jgi:uncharacterized protein (TIGR02453 family)
MAGQVSFDRALFDFLRDLAANNEREWFTANRERYMAQVRNPMLDFISNFAPHLAAISARYVADPRANGGSMFRIHRDVRFSRDKRPYKTNAGAHFRHEAARDVHAPGFYLHLEPGRVFAAAGVWHPDGPALAKIREALVDKADAWLEVTSPDALGSRGEMAGESLKRPPRGFDPDHPLIEDIKRKDFFATARFTEDEACAPGFMDEFATTCRAFSPLARFLTSALELTW